MLIYIINLRIVCLGAPSLLSSSSTWNCAPFRNAGIFPFFKRMLLGTFACISGWTHHKRAMRREVWACCI